jgi:hypothetical protein
MDKPAMEARVEQELDVWLKVLKHAADEATSMWEDYDWPKGELLALPPFYVTRKFIAAASPDAVLKLIATVATLRADGTKAAEEIAQSRKCLDEIPSALKLHGLYIRGTPNSIIQVSDAFKKIESLQIELARERERHQQVLNYVNILRRNDVEVSAGAILADIYALLEAKAEPAPVDTGEEK